jgi:DNA polymerase-3 subunit beta
MSAEPIDITGASGKLNYMAGCDGHRLAIKPHNLNLAKEILIPADSLKKVGGVLMKDEDIHFALGSSEVYFSQNNIFASLRLFEGAYPKYKQIIPTTAYDEISISREAFLDSLKKVTPMFDRGQTVNFTASHEHLGPGGNIRLQTQCSELGEAECFCEGQVAKPFSSAFSAQYMEQAVNRLESDIVTLRVRDEKTPIEIREGDYIHIIMPKRVGG